MCKLMRHVVCVWKVGEVRRLIDKISSQVDEVVKKHSAILSAPNPEESEYGLLTAAHIHTNCLKMWKVQENHIWMKMVPLQDVVQSGKVTY